MLTAQCTQACGNLSKIYDGGAIVLEGKSAMDFASELYENNKYARVDISENWPEPEFVRDREKPQVVCNG